METTKTELKPIPVDFVCQQARTLSGVKRKPLVNLIGAWGEESQCTELATEIVKTLSKAVVEIDTRNMPSLFYPLFREVETAKKLQEVIQRIHIKISNKTEPWDWALVMKVMMDELIIMRTTANKFDTIISQMIPQHPGRIRKSGDYTITKEKDDPWSLWPKNSTLNPTKAELRTKCNQIAIEFQDLLGRKILLDY